MSKQLCPDCGKTRPVGAPDGACPTCLLQLGVAARPVAVVTPGAGGGFADYELFEEIARGGMGAVFRARQISLHRVVALKMLLPGVAGPEWVRRFRTEAEAAASLNHPGIVAIHEVGEHDGQPFFSMEYVPGQDLARRVKLQPPSVTESAHWTRQIAVAVHHAHQRGVLHRDLKPANVLLDDTGHARVTDFGLAKLLGDPRDATVAGRVMGTPSYMSPEQLDPQRGETTIASDVYGLGTILYFLLTGKPPFQAATIEQALLSVLNSEPVPPRTLNPAVPRDLEIICLKCLAKEPARRYGTALEVADEIGRFLERKPIQARPATTAERLQLWARRNPVVASLTLLLVLTVTVALVSQWQSLRRVQHARDQTEDNIRYTVESLAPQLREVGRSALVADVLKRLRPYFEEQSRERRDGKFRALHAGFLMVDASLDREMGDAPQARSKTEQALQVLAPGSDEEFSLSTQTNLARAHATMRDVLRDARDIPAALRHGETALALCTEVWKRDPHNGSLAAQLAEAHFGLGEVGEEADLFDVEQFNYEAGASLTAGLIARTDAEPSWINLHAVSHYHRGVMWLRRRDTARAEQHSREYLRLSESLVVRVPGDPRWLNSLSMAHAHVSLMLLENTKEPGQTNAALRAEARRELEIALQQSESLTLRDPGHVIWQRNYALLLMRIGELAATTGSDPAQIGSWYATAYERLLRLFEAEPARASWAEYLSEATSKLARWHERQGQTNQARVFLEQSVARQFQAIARFPEQSAHYQRLADAMGELGKQFRRTEGLDVQVAYLRRNRETLPSTNGHWRWTTAALHGAVANAYYQLHQWELTAQAMEPSLEIRRALFHDVPDEARLWIYLSTTYRYLGECYAQLGREAEALTLAEEALHWLKENPVVAQTSYALRVRLADLCVIVSTNTQPAPPAAPRAERLLQRALDELLPEPLTLALEKKQREKVLARLAQLRPGALPP